MSDLTKLLIVLCILGLLSGCGNDNDRKKETAENKIEQKEKTNNKDNKSSKAETEQKNTKLSDNIFDFQVELDDVVYTLPFSYEKLKDLGWEAHANAQDLQPGASTQITLTNDSEKHKSLSGIFLNTGTRQRNFAECDIAGFEISDLDVKNISFHLPKGITIGSKKEEVMNAYGEPQATTMGIEYRFENDHYKSINFMFDKNDVVNMITIRNT